jgi:hypothetical protein
MPLPSGSRKNVIFNICASKLKKENTEITNGA